MLVNCPECNARLRVGEAVPGKAIRCPKCSKVFRVPTSEAPTTKPTGTATGKPSAPAPHAAAPASVSPPLGESSPPEDDNDEARTETKPKKLKRKKKKSDHTTLVIVVSLGVVLGLALVGGGGFAVWYFLSRKSPDRAAAEMLEIMEAFAGALEKLKEPGQRAQGTADLDGVTQRLEAWIEKYKDLEISESERQRLEAKYGDRAKQIAERIGKVFLTLLLDPQVMQDPRVTSALGRFMQSVERIPKTIKTEVAPLGWQKPAPSIPGPRPFQPKPVSPSPPR